MCGRYQLTAAPDAVRALFAYEELPNFPPRLSISPSEPIGIVTQSFGVRHFKLVRWGFLPSFAKDVSTVPLLFNARAETAAEKPSFRHALRRRRCLVPATGFYEWRREGEGRGARKTPFLCTRRDGGILALGGIWETYVAPDGSEMDTAAILTTTANGTMAAIHERMPVIIEPADFAAWLDGTDERIERVAPLMAPAGDDVLVLEEVSPDLTRPFRRAPSPSPEAPPRPARPGRPDDGQGSLF
jgi:putative SOS response-associated peptidase YedK